MTGLFGLILAGWRELARKAGLAVVLLAGSAALGLAIAWPLWYFATSSRGAYTVSVLCITCGAVAALSTRAALRRRRAPRDPGRPRRGPLAALLAVLKVLLLVLGLYAAALLLIRRLWLPAIPVLLAWVALLGWIGLGRRSPKSR